MMPGWVSSPGGPAEGLAFRTRAAMLHDAMGNRPADTRTPSLIAALTRAGMVRCPRCGIPWPRRKVIDLVACCSTCRLRLDRGERDYFLGAYSINLMFALAGAIGLAVAANLFPLSSWAIYGVGLVVLAALVLVLYAVSRLLWLAIDLQFRPASDRDFDSPPESRRPEGSGAV